ncbi:MAG: DUF2779 domain-containing protein [Bacteroidales bacterium]|nr:DUF2779 domain-containing protein [Bacteroidales bacterium]
MLSKSKYVRGMNCRKSLWLYVHKKEDQEISESTQLIFSKGTSVGELARTYFPKGKNAVMEPFPSFIAAKRTQSYIQAGLETIYEATFVYNNTLVAVDILHKENGKWNLYEVKSTNSVKPEHFKDISIQYYVVKACGLEVGDAFLMHFNREYVRKGAIDVQQLFLPESVLPDVLVLQAEIPAHLAELEVMLKGEEPQIEMGGQCEKPYFCDYYNYCMRLNPQQKKENIILSNEPEVNTHEVRNFVNSVSYPICYLDFETIMPGIPLFDESRPYQQIPFQYSLHYQETKESELKHSAYLAESNLSIDPRRGLIEQLIKETADANTIFVYNIAFERTRLNEMKRDFPIYAEELKSIIERLTDLIIPFRKKFYRTESMQSLYSIKVVLPILCPELSYHSLEISDGMSASNAFLELYYTNDKEHILKVRDELLKYCHLDTLAMVKIWDVLKTV